MQQYPGFCLQDDSGSLDLRQSKLCADILPNSSGRTTLLLVKEQMVSFRVLGIKSQNKIKWAKKPLNLTMYGIHWGYCNLHFKHHPINGISVNTGTSVLELEMRGTWRIWDKHPSSKSPRKLLSEEHRHFSSSWSLSGSRLKLGLGLGLCGRRTKFKIWPNARKMNTCKGCSVAF